MRTRIFILASLVFLMAAGGKSLALTSVDLSKVFRSNENKPLVKTHPSSVIALMNMLFYKKGGE